MNQGYTAHVRQIKDQVRHMVLKIDFNSEEAIYIQLRNQIVIGIATSQIEGRTGIAVCPSACGSHWN